MKTILLSKINSSKEQHLSDDYYHVYKIVSHIVYALCVHMCVLTFDYMCAGPRSLHIIDLVVES